MPPSVQQDHKSLAVMNQQAGLTRRTEQPPEDAQSKESKKADDKHKIVNIITKFSFATKGGISAHNPYKVN